MGALQLLEPLSCDLHGRWVKVPAAKGETMSVLAASLLGASAPARLLARLASLAPPPRAPHIPNFSQGVT